MKLNHVVHHGAIGHHVQNYYAYHGESAIGRVAAVDCASRIGMFLGGTMAEGWACYATDLMDEAGFLTPEESVAQQHTRARLLARAIVDIGLHERSLTVDEAVGDLPRSDRHGGGGGTSRDLQELDVPRHRVHVLAGHRGPASAPSRARARRGRRRFRSAGFTTASSATDRFRFPSSRG